MKELLLASLIAASLAAGTTTAQTTKEQESSSQANLQGHENFRGTDLVVAGQEHWYRELRLDSWQAMGLEQQEIASVLARIKGDKPLRDETNPDTTGHWTFEFAKQANQLNQLAKKQEQEQAALSYQKAATFWMIASYPNLHQAHELKALDNAVAAYVKAANLRGEQTQRVSMPLANGSAISGILHMPKDVVSPPVVLWTGGVDKSLVEHHASLNDTVQNGTAVITFDMPGAGLNSAITLQLGKESIAHEAALNYVKTNSRLDSSRVAVLSQSGAGIPLIEFAIDNPALKAVVARCAVVDGVLTKPSLFPRLPLMTAQSFGVRIGADIHDLESFGELTIPLSLKTKGYFDGKTRMDIPMLVINTSGDRVASAKDMQYTAALSSQGVVEFYGDDGHCPEGQEAADSITRFLAKHI